MREIKQYIGPGPPLMDENVIFPDQSNVRLIKNDLIQLLNTMPGERIMNPEFGTNIKSSLFELFDQGLVLSLKGSIAEAISKWEPRIDLIDILINEDINNPHIIIITILARTKEDRKELKLTLKFNNETAGTR